MENRKLKTEDFVEYSNWLSKAHRNIQNSKIKPDRILKNHQVTIDTTQNNSKTVNNHNHDPVVQFEEVDGVVKNIEITCSCGEQLRLALDYDNEPSQPVK